MNLTHTKVLDRIREMESPPEHDYQVRSREDYRKAKQAMKDLGNAINGGVEDATALGLLAGLMTEHRYLQNNLVCILLTVLGNLPEVEGTDARNEFGIGLCNRLRETFKDDLFWKDPA